MSERLDNSMRPDGWYDPKRGPAADTLAAWDAFEDPRLADDLADARRFRHIAKVHRIFYPDADTPRTTVNVGLAGDGADALERLREAVDWDMGQGK